MSGIAGISDFFSEQPASDRLHVMLDAMVYRGPEGRGSQALGGSAFGHLVLNTTSVPEKQPVSRSGCLLVADVHLTQREALCGSLSCATSFSDSELLLEAYLVWGEDCVHHLNGSFAFAVFDGNRLFVARDRLGIKPLYYADGSYADGSGRRLIFASEAKPVARETGANLSAIRFADALVFPLEHVDKVCTPWEGVYRLPPGTCLTAGRQGVSLRQYWDGSHITPREMSDDAWVSLFRETLLTVLQDHQTPGEVMGMTLSGGVDSGTLACMAAAAGLPVRCFSTVVKQGYACKETKHIELAISRCDLDVYQIEPADLDSDADLLLTLLSNLQEPFDAHMLQLMILNLAAKRLGHSTLIDGVDGEMIYSMPSNYSSLLYRQGRYSEGVREAWHASRMTRQNPIASLYDSVRGLGAPALLRGVKRNLKHLVGTHEFSDMLDESWISTKWAEELRIAERLREMHSRLYQVPTSMFEAHRQSVTHPGIAAALERYDRVAAMTGIEYRHPLLDLRMVELMLSAPDHLKVRSGWSKYLLRLAGAPDVPVEISWRTDKEENAWCFAERLAELKGGAMKTYLQQHRQSLAPFVKTEALDTGDEMLAEVFGICHWLETQREEFDLAC